MYVINIIRTTESDYVNKNVKYCNLRILQTKRKPTLYGLFSGAKVIRNIIRSETNYKYRTYHIYYLCHMYIDSNSTGSFQFSPNYIENILYGIS